MKVSIKDLKFNVTFEIKELAFDELNEAETILALHSLNESINRLRIDVTDQIDEIMNKVTLTIEDYKNS